MMNKFVRILLLFLATVLPLHAQQNEEATNVLSYIQKVMNFNKVVPQEKVYLHFDNTGYFKNETMWFKAYVTRTDNGRATDLSKVLYVELLNPTGDVIQTHKYPIDSLGQAHGEMKMDTILGSGFYEVRAYTRYMTNWGVNAVFSRVFPVFNTPKTEGDYSDLTIKPVDYRHRLPNLRDTSDSLYTNAVFSDLYSSNLAKTVSVRFYPEGGSLIAGKRCRVAMLAVDDNGRAYEGEGFVMNTRGDVLASVQTDTLGRGLFELVPDVDSLTFQMRNLKKNKRGQVQFFPMPKARAEGCALSMDAVSERMVATLQCTRGICGRLLGYAVMHNGNITYCDTVVARPLIEIELDRQRQEEGVSQLTVFDSKGEILAERLFFICPKHDSADSVRVMERTERLKPCGKVEVELRTRPNASLSFSAIDYATMNNGKQGNMKTWMLIASEVRGYIHNVGYYFEADDREHRLSADLLMMTQGWRRYDWNLMAGLQGLEKVQPIEDRFYLYGKLNTYRKRNPVGNVNMEVHLYNQGGQSLTGRTRTDSLGYYSFAMPFLDGEWKMQIYTRKKMGKGDWKRKTYYVGIDRRFSPTGRYITPLEASALHPLTPNLFRKDKLQELSEEDEFIPITQKNHVLQNVTVKAKRRYFTNDDYMYKNEAFGKKYAALYYNIDKELDKILDMGGEIPTITDFVNSKLRADLDVYGNREDRYHGRPIEWILDNNGRRSGAFSGFLDEVKSIYIVFSGEIPASIMTPTNLGNQDNRILVYVYHHFIYSAESQKGLRKSYFQGFNKPATFKMEDYNVIPPMADFRRTIYWNPDIKTDAQGKATVEFFNNSTCEEMYISTEGMTNDGKILVNE
ncbi:MAG: hypothetical protein IJ693_05020 [Bacteroidaceae bacterium]|nr:hypothetical protein [Bacteroidaceae bacterium]